MAPPLVIWDDRMMEYDLGGQHPLHPLRLELTWKLARGLGVLDGVELHSPRPADDPTLCTVHTPAYVAAVREASIHGGPTRLIGHGLGTDDNPVFENMHDLAALIAGGSVEAALAIANGRTDRAINLAGGLHHAMPDHASGFCIYNDAALAITAMLDAGVKKIAYVDVDVHHGDGVHAAFYNDPRVLTVSLHESPHTLWPGTGYPGEYGRGPAAGTAVNIPVPAGASDAVWLRAFHAVVPGIVTAFRPEVLVTQHGADTHREDPLADLLVTVDGQLTVHRALRALAEKAAGGRWLALGGGGYALVRVVPRSWTHLLATVLDRDLDPRTPVPADWTADAVSARPAISPPIDMTDGAPEGATYEPWDGSPDLPGDRWISEVRRLVYPLHGLDPHDPRD